MVSVLQNSEPFITIDTLNEFTPDVILKYSEREIVSFARVDGGWVFLFPNRDFWGIRNEALTQERMRSIAFVLNG